MQGQPSGDGTGMTTEGTPLLGRYYDVGRPAVAAAQVGLAPEKISTTGLSCARSAITASRR